MVIPPQGAWPMAVMLALCNNIIHRSYAAPPFRSRSAWPMAVMLALGVGAE